MKDWFGILIFVGIAIANIVMEQNRQKKKKAATVPRPASPPPVPVTRTTSSPRRRTPAALNNIPSKAAEPSLQGVLQTLQQAAESDAQRTTAPPARRNPELEHREESFEEMPRPSLVRAALIPPAAPAPSSSAVVSPAPLLQAKPAVILSSPEKPDFRSRTALRRAIIMSELLGKPKGLQ